MIRTLNGTLKKAGFRQGDHYEIVSQREVFEREPQVFVHRRRGWRHWLLATLGMAGMGAIAFPNPKVKAAGLMLIGLEGTLVAYHMRKTANEFDAETLVSDEIEREKHKLTEHAKSINNLNGPAIAAAFTIGGGKIFFLTREARNHLLKIGRWNKTSFDLGEQEKPIK